jgi:hypothetical protein
MAQAMRQRREKLAGADNESITVMCARPPPGTCHYTIAANAPLGVSAVDIPGLIGTEFGGRP